MPLKAKISDSDFQSLDESLKSLYVKEGNDYKIDIEGYVVEKDPAALLNAKEHEKRLRQEAESMLKKLQEEIKGQQDALKKAQEEAELEKARKSGDISSIQKSFETKIAEMQKQQSDQLTRYREAVAKAELDRVANQIAGKIGVDANAATLLLPHVKARLQADMNEDLPKIRVLDSNGELSIGSVDDLQKEFIANPAFGAIIVGSKATGASGHGNVGGAKVSTQGKKFTDFSASELSQIRKENPQEYERLKRDTLTK
jgi:hypothetical protein